MMRKYLSLGLLLSTLCLAGCSTTLEEYSLVSNRNIDLNHSQHFVRGNKSEAGDMRLTLFIFPLGSLSTDAVLKAAIDKDRCVVALTDVTITEHSLWAVYVGLKTLIVDGRKLIDTRIPGCENRQ